jgi:hypothetical protein
VWLYNPVESLSNVEKKRKIFGIINNNTYFCSIKVKVYGRKEISRNRRRGKHRYV